MRGTSSHFPLHGPARLRVLQPLRLPSNPRERSVFASLPNIGVTSLAGSVLAAPAASELCKTPERSRRKETMVSGLETKTHRVLQIRHADVLADEDG